MDFESIGHAFKLIVFYFIGAVGWLALTFGAAALGARFLPDEWYRQLNKPTWNPPDAIFAPVWALLYLLMAASAWLV